MWQEGRPEFGPAGRISTSSPCPPPPGRTGIWLGHCPLDRMAPLSLCPWPGGGGLDKPTEQSSWTGHRVCSEGAPVQTLTLYPLTALAGGFQSSLHFPHPPGLRWRIQGGAINTMRPGDWLWASCGPRCLSLPGWLTSSLVLSPLTW